jgi:filamentous hemagglutinin
MLKKIMAWIAIYGMTFSPALAGAQIRADQSAPKNQQPQVISTAGGVPQVNINTPNQSGLSHNKYQQFDVDRPGAILNNSTKNVQTQLGGWVEGNPNLAAGSARIILNEVNSRQPSQLKGHVEVAGQRAEVIIANPSGIQVDGGGFINASKATLTTGTPQINGGQVTGYLVEGGRVEINGQGLNADTADYTAIISQSAAVNAGIWAKDLTVTTGNNQVSADGSQAAPLNPNAGEIQGVALDVSNLGGMYAGHIKLIGTDKGLGVRNAGEIAAQVGEVTITQDGRLENSGTISGQTAARIESKDEVENTGRIQSDGTVAVKAKALKNRNEVVASRKVEVQAAREVVNTGLIEGGEVVVKAGKIENVHTGTMLADHLALQGDEIVNGLSLGQDGEVGKGGLTASGLIGARDRLDIGAGKLTNREDGLIYSGGDIHIGGLLDAANEAVGRAAEILNSSAVIEAAASLYVTVVDFFNRNPHYKTELRVVRDWNWQGYGWPGDPHVYIQGVDGHWNGGVDDHGYGGRHDTEDFYLYYVHRVERDTFVIESRPGFIYTGGDFVVDGNLTNDHSRIIVGGSILAEPSDAFAVKGTFTNIAALEPYIITDTGNYRWTHVEAAGLFGDDHEREFDGAVSYNPPDDITYNEKDVVLNNNYPSSSSTQDAVTEISPESLNRNLFSIDPDCTSGYLIESNPRLTDYRVWLSSDFMLTRLNADPEVTLKRLGDGFYEQRLVREQIAGLTGLRFLGGFDSDEDQYMALMLAGAEFAEQYQLTPGVALSAEQMALLTSDIVWLEEVTVQTENGPVKALAPKVYLAPGREPVMNPNGTVVSAKNIDMDLSGFQNSGTLLASESLGVSAENIDNSGTISGRRVNLAALNDLNNIGGAIIGTDRVSLTAGNDLNIVSATETTTTNGADHYGSRTKITRRAGVMVTGEDGSLAMTAGRDINLKAASVGSMGSASLEAGRDLNVGTVEESYEYKSWSDAQNSRYYSTQTDSGSEIVTGGDLTLTAGRDLSVTGSQVTSGGALSGQAGRDISVTEGRSKSVVDDHVFVKRSTTLGSKSTTISASNSSDRAIGSSLSGDTVTLTAGGDVTVRGSEAAAVNGLDVTAGGDITVSGAENRGDSQYSVKHTRSGLSGSLGSNGFSVGYGKSESGNEDTNRNLTHTGSSLHSDSGPVSLEAGKDVTLSGSRVAAEAGDVSISGENVTIEQQVNTVDVWKRQYSKQSGLTLGVQLGGAAPEAVQTAMAMPGKLDTLKKAEGLVDRGKSAGGLVGDGHNIYQNMETIYKTIRDNNSRLEIANVSAKLSFGKSSSESTAETHKRTVAGSVVEAGNDVTIIARGDGAGNGGDLSVIGSEVRAEGTVNLEAANDLNLLSAEETETTETHEKSSSSSAGVSASYGANGFGVSVDGSYGREKGDGNSASATHVETMVKGGKGVNFKSGRDTTLKGAVMEGETVQGEVGGNLTIVSEQDTMDERFDYKHDSVGISVPVYGVKGDATLTYGQDRQSGKSSYRSVNEQSGIYAGSGGFRINVKGNTGLTGAVIASEAEADENLLVTGTLTMNDLRNERSYNAKTGGWGVKVSAKPTWNTGVDPEHPKPQATVPDYGSSTVGVNGSVDLPMKDKGSDDSVTRSAIAPGMIVITDAERQAALDGGQDMAAFIAGVNRDTAHAHDGPLDKNPDVKKLLAEQKATAEAVKSALENLSKGINLLRDRVNKEYAEAVENRADAKKVLDDPDRHTDEELKAAQSKYKEADLIVTTDLKKKEEYEKWSQGGEYRVALQVVGTLLASTYGNGEAVQAVLGMGAGYLAGENSTLQEFAKLIASHISDDPDRQKAYAENIQREIAKGLSNLVGGDTGQFDYENGKPNEQPAPDQQAKND